MEYRYLSNIDSPADLKKVPREDLPVVAEELRDYLISVVSKVGGHLASSLGAVELTLALHYLFDTPNDKIVWDVGHQAYGHKVLTGRRDRLATIRQYGGISGFPVRDESPYDTFNVAHAGTAISGALGMAVARDLKGEDFHVVAVVGDDFTAMDEAVFRGRKIDLAGLEHASGKTFFWAGKYSQNLNERTTLVTDLNVFATFRPTLPKSFTDSPFVFLGNIDPELQLGVLEQRVDGTAGLGRGGPLPAENRAAGLTRPQADHALGELKSSSPRQGLDLEKHVPILAVAASLLLVLVLRLGCSHHRLFERNSRQG